jgi:gliding motility-associated-like protein
VQVTETTPAPASCSANSAIVNVTIINVPSPTITGNLNVCQGVNPTYSVTNNVGNTYNWTVTNGTIVSGQGTNSIVVNWGNSTSGTVSVIETTPTPGSCANNPATSVNVTITPLPTPTISGGNNQLICQGTNPTYSVTNNPGNTYNWVITVTGASIVSGQGTSSIVVDWGATTNGTIQVTETTPAPSSCAGVSSLVNLTRITTPNTTITGNFNLCADGTATYTAPNPPSTPAGLTYNYTWQINGGTVVAPSTLNSNPITVKWTDNPAGTEYIRVTITAVFNGTPTSCTATTPLPSGPSDNGFVTLNDLPNPTISGNALVCKNTSVTYTTPNLPINSTFTWNVLDGNGTDITSTSAVTGQGTNTINVTWGNAGTGKITVTQTTPAPNSCSRTTAAYDVVVQDVPAMPISPDRFRCGGAGNITLNATLTGATGFNWYNVATGGTPLVNNSSYTANVTTSPTSFWVAAINNLGCEGPRKEVVVTLDPANSQVQTQALITNADSCMAVAGDSPSGRILLNLTGNNQNGPYTFSWSKVEDTNFSANTQNLFAITRGTYNVAITDAGGCVTNAGPFVVDEVLAQITDAQVNGSANFSAIIAQGTDYTLNATATNAATFEWRDMNNNVVGTNASLTLTPNNIVIDPNNNTGTYTVRITNNRNCFVILTVSIKVVKLQVFVPSVFTPNGDNKNDLLRVYGTGIKSVNFKVFNRLGQLVFETDEFDPNENQSKGWDGTFNGVSLHQDNYVWSITGKFIDGTDIKVEGRTTGNVMLMR